MNALADLVTQSDTHRNMFSQNIRFNAARLTLGVTMQTDKQIIQDILEEKRRSLNAVCNWYAERPGVFHTGEIENLQTQIDVLETVLSAIP